jgi:hypothetical protein
VLAKKFYSTSRDNNCLSTPLVFSNADKDKLKILRVNKGRAGVYR